MEGIFIVKAASAMAAALVMGIGSLMPAYGQGIVAAKACENMGKYPESARTIRGAMFMAMGIIETSAIYAFLISLFLIFIGLR
ncbi:MAG: ATP synthase F0 subunit C [Candidatus Babeliales bacterium]